MSTPICSLVFCRTWRMSATVRVVGVAGGAVSRGVFDPEPDMVVGVHGGGEGFSGEIDDLSSDEDSELIGRGGVLGCWDDTLEY